MVRPNQKLNVLAIDTKNVESTKALFGLTLLVELPVIAYESLPRELAAGVTYEVPGDLINGKLQLAVRATATFTSTYGLGTSENVKLTISTGTLPDYVTLGYTRHKLQPYIEKPCQCWKCCRFGHVQTGCSKEGCCSRCGGAHDRSEHQADRPFCTNFGKAHYSSSRMCAAYQKEKQTYQYQSEAQMVGYATAKAALYSHPKSKRPKVIPKYILSKQDRM